jgi:hypothetical protein
VARYRVRIQREGFPVYRRTVDAADENAAVSRVLGDETTPEWAAEADWQDVTVDQPTREAD